MKYRLRKNIFLLHKHFSELAQVTPGEMDQISAFVELIHQPQYHTLLAGGSAIFIKTQSLFKGATYLCNFLDVTALFVKIVRFIYLWRGDVWSVLVPEVAFILTTLRSADT